MDEPNIYQDILVELKCSICTNFMSPPIIQCSSGHCVCESCTRKLPKCTLCQSEFTDVRNNFLENMARKIRYPCINKSLGCNTKLTLDERKTHEDTCSFIIVKCAMSNCFWRGKVQDVSKHWSLKKSKSKAYEASNVCHTKIKYHMYYANMVEAYDQLFWFKCKVEHKKIHWAVQFLGHSKTATKYYYEIEVFKPGQSKRKIVFSDYCQAADLDNDELLKEGACMTASVGCLKRLIDEDYNLTYYMRVYEDWEYDPECAEKNQLKSSKELVDVKKDKPHDVKKKTGLRHKNADFKGSFADVRTFRRKCV